MAVYTSGNGAGKLEFRVESTLGTSAAAWKGLRPEENPTVNTEVVSLIPVSHIGHQNPFETHEAKPVIAPLAVQPGAFGLKTAVYPPAAGNEPSIVTLMKSTGLDCKAIASADVTAGTPAVDSIEFTAVTPTVGDAVLVELLNGDYFPMLVADVTTKTATPSMDLPSAPHAVGGALEVMHCFSPRTDTTFSVADGKSLQFQWHGHPLYDDTLGDLVVRRIAAALEGIGEISIPNFGEKFMFDLTFQGMQQTLPDDVDMDSDNLVDIGIPLILNDKFNFGFAAADVSGGITAAAKYARDVKINLGVKVEPVPYHGGGTIGGIQQYHLQFETATASFIAGFDSSAKAEIAKAMVGPNVDTYLHFVQPSASATTPSFGLWLPKCHLSKTPDIMLFEKIVEYKCDYTASIAGYDNGVFIDDAGAAPWYMAFGGRAAVA